MSDELRDTWVYQQILKEGREEGLKEGREEERKRREEERKQREEERKQREEERKQREEERRQELERWRQTMLSLVQVRFASQKMELLAEGQAAIIKDPKILQDLIVKVGAAQTAEEAQDYLLSWKKAS